MDKYQMEERDKLAIKIKIKNDENIYEAITIDLVNGISYLEDPDRCRMAFVEWENIEKVFRPTGKKDKNGISVYEDDIVNIEINDNCFMEGRIKIESFGVHLNSQNDIPDNKNKFWEVIKEKNT